MTTEPTNECADCGATFYYAPNLHECPNTSGVTLANPYAGMSWVDECMTKQRETR